MSPWAIGRFYRGLPGPQAATSTSQAAATTGDNREACLRFERALGRLFQAISRLSVDKSGRLTT